MAQIIWFTEPKNWILAFTALKDEYQSYILLNQSDIRLNKELRLNFLENDFFQAYIEFLNNNFNDLRNIVFPINRKKSIIFPDEELVGPAYKLISGVLVKLFKGDHIKSLLLGLVLTNFQMLFALDLLKEMKIIGQSEFNAQMEKIKEGIKAKISTILQNLGITDTWDDIIKNKSWDNVVLKAYQAKCAETNNYLKDLSLKQKSLDDFIQRIENERKLNTEEITRHNADSIIEKIKLLEVNVSEIEKDIDFVKLIYKREIKEK